MDIKITHVSKKEPTYKAIRPGSEEVWGARIAEMARQGAALGDCGKMCADCAFKHPQPPTQDYYDAVDGAVQILLMGGKFNCHTDDHQDADKPCSGYRYASLYADRTDKEDEA